MLCERVRYKWDWLCMPKKNIYVFIIEMLECNLPSAKWKSSTVLSMFDLVAWFLILSANSWIRRNARSATSSYVFYCWRCYDVNNLIWHHTERSHSLSLIAIFPSIINLVFIVLLIVCLYVLTIAHEPCSMFNILPISFSKIRHLSIQNHSPILYILVLIFISKS